MSNSLKFVHTISNSSKMFSCMLTIPAIELQMRVSLLLQHFQTYQKLLIASTMTIYFSSWHVMVFQSILLYNTILTSDLALISIQIIWPLAGLVCAYMVGLLAIRLCMQGLSPMWGEIHVGVPQGQFWVNMDYL